MTPTVPSSIVTNVLDLDKMVSDYLLFRNCGEASLALLRKREFFRDEYQNDDEKPVIAGKILAAFDSGDYALLLSLWESYVIQSSNESLSTTLAYEMKAVEYLCNLHCAVYPFRAEVIRKVGEGST